MNKKQAMALLTLIADLYTVMQGPDPEMVAPASSNGKGHVDAPAAAAAVD